MMTEIKTDAMNEDELLALKGDLSNGTCNGFAFSYLEEVNENAVVKDCIVKNVEHCYVYDPDLGVSIDGTLSQFDDAEAGAWDGETHPLANDDDEVFEWTDREEFREHYSQHGKAASPFHFWN